MYGSVKCGARRIVSAQETAAATPFLFYLHDVYSSMIYTQTHSNARQSPGGADELFREGDSGHLCGSGDHGQGCHRPGGQVEGGPGEALVSINKGTKAGKFRPCLERGKKVGLLRVGGERELLPG